MPYIFRSIHALVLSTSIFIFVAILNIIISYYENNKRELIFNFICDVIVHIGIIAFMSYMMFTVINK